MHKYNNKYLFMKHDLEPTAETMIAFSLDDSHVVHIAVWRRTPKKMNLFRGKNKEEQCNAMQKAAVTKLCSEKKISEMKNFSKRNLNKVNLYACARY